MKQPHIATISKAGAAWLLMAASPLAGAQTPAPAPATAPAPAPKAPAHSHSPAANPAKDDPNGYLFGLTFGEQMRRVGVTDQVSVANVARGIKDGLQGKKTTPADQQQLNAYVRSLMQAALARNQTAAKEFLARNVHAAGVITTASGLQYKVINPGDAQAAPVAPTDQVTVQYRGKLLDGSEFDSSYSRGTPATFPVNGVIRGWQEALVLMKPGAKWELFVPPELAYGSAPKAGIPGGSLLIFEVELLNVKPGATAAAPAPAAPPASAPAAPPASPPASTAAPPASTAGPPAAPAGHPDTPQH
jgi:FKBP-type peptidyl-prolyl cis-trans isomerase